MVNGRTYQFPVSMIEGIRRTISVGIHSNCTWIMGSPTETLEDLKETVAFIMWQQEFYAQHGIPAEAVNRRMFTMTWYPGTKLIRHERVRAELKRIFGLSFDENHEPVCDANLHRYLLALDDATKVLHGENNEPLNFGAMPTDQFLQARSYIDNGKIENIVDM